HAVDKPRIGGLADRHLRARPVAVPASVPGRKPQAAGRDVHAAAGGRRFTVAGCIQAGDDHGQVGFDPQECTALARHPPASVCGILRAMASTDPATATVPAPVAGLDWDSRRMRAFAERALDLYGGFLVRLDALASARH